MATKEDAPAVDLVEQWRRDELERAGYPDEYAVILAERDDIDLHEACELLDHGCPWKLAIHILT